MPAQLPLPPKTPTLEKERACHPECDHISAFFDWLSENYGDQPVHDIKIWDVIHEYFGIDQQDAENERREVLAHLRISTMWHEIRKELGLDSK